MITVRIIHDMETAAAAMRHPEVYPFIRDDGAPLIAEEWVPQVGGCIEYLGAWEDGVYLGLWMFHRRNHATWEIHTCLLPAARGRTALEAVKIAGEWFWRNHPECERVVTAISGDNRRALWFARESGMVEWGRNPNGVRRNGVLIDEIWLGMSRPKGT